MLRMNYNNIINYSEGANGFVGLARNGFVGLSVGGAGSGSTLLRFRPELTNPLPGCSIEPYDESFFFSMLT